MKECIICMVEFDSGTQIIRIPTCQHFFHKECVKKWFDMKLKEKLDIKCPYCNNLLNPDEMKLAKDQ